MGFGRGGEGDFETSELKTFSHSLTQDPSISVMLRLTHRLFIVIHRFGRVFA